MTQCTFVHSDLVIGDIDDGHIAADIDQQVRERTEHTVNKLSGVR